MLYLFSQQCDIRNTISPPGQGFSAANTHLFASNVLAKKLKNRLRKDLYFLYLITSILYPVMGQSSWLPPVKALCVLTAAIRLCCGFHSRWNSDHWVLPADYPTIFHYAWYFSPAEPALPRENAQQRSRQVSKSPEYTGINHVFVTKRYLTELQGSPFSPVRSIYCSPGERGGWAKREITTNISASNRAPVLRDATFWGFLHCFR